MWKMIKKFFKDSETIFWARVQTFASIIAVAVYSVDPSLLRDHVPLWVFIGYTALNGVITEYLRRRRDPSLGAST